MNLKYFIFHQLLQATVEVGVYNYDVSLLAKPQCPPRPRGY